jgi:hypothetical protein
VQNKKKSIGSLTENLFSDNPREPLYHYTTLTGLLGIVRDKSLWASDIRYMNDSAELRHAADLIRLEVQERIARGRGKADLLGQFVDWVDNRITNGHLLFGASFRSHGNLLSQWRGYSDHGKGVSIGFSAEYILQCAVRQQFQIGKCIYEPERQKTLIQQIVNAVEAHVDDDAREKEYQKTPAAKYRQVFESIELDLLRIASILKHPSFREEMEWRIVSPVYTDQAAAPILFREAHSMLVPYVEFNLQQNPNQPLQFEHLYLGPTTNINISMNSLKMFLAQNGIIPRNGIDYCRIPFRQR